MVKDYTICLTGHTGYVGSHFLNFLKKNGHSPFLIGRRGQTVDTVYGCKVANKWFTANDIAGQLAELPRPIVVNLAGLFISQHKSQDLDGLITSNLSYPLNLFEALTKLDNVRIVNIGTAWEYSDTGLNAPINLYAKLKETNASALEWYTDHYSFKSINLKLNDTYGGNDPRSKLMPILKKSYQEKTTPQLNYSTQKINLLHIFDVCDGLLSAAQRTLKLENQTMETAFLLGDETVTMKSLIKKIQSLSSGDFNVHFSDKFPKNGNLRQVWEEAPRLLNWRPKITLNEGLQEYFGTKNELGN